MIEDTKRVKPVKDRYTLTLEAPDSGDSAIRRLRAALKTLLRSFGLRCVRIEPAKEKPCKISD